MRYVNLAIVLVFRLVSMKGSEISKGTLSFDICSEKQINIVCQIKNGLKMDLTDNNIIASVDIWRRPQ